MQTGVEDESVLQVTVPGLAGEGSGRSSWRSLHRVTGQRSSAAAWTWRRVRAGGRRPRRVGGKEMDVAGRFPVPDFPVTDPDFGMVSTDAAAWTPALLVAGLALDGRPQWADQKFVAYLSRSYPRIAHDIYTARLPALRLKIPVLLYV
jgi:hypothetical protein